MRRALRLASTKQIATAVRAKIHQIWRSPAQQEEDRRALRPDGNKQWLEPNVRPGEGLIVTMADLGRTAVGRVRLITDKDEPRPQLGQMWGRPTDADLGRFPLGGRQVHWAKTTLGGTPSR